MKMAGILEEKLREAACVGDSEAVINLLTQNIDINSQNSVNGWTALHWACKRGNDDIAKILIENGADQSIRNFKGLTPSEVCYPESEQIGNQQDQTGLRYTPNYLKNPSINSQVDIGSRIRTKHSDLAKMPTTSLPTSQSDDLVLKVRIHGSSDPDFIEVEIPRWKLTFGSLLKICCAELDIPENQVERIRKLPDTRLRRDSDVKRLKDNQALEIVLKSPANGDKSVNCYQSISTCKNQTILY
nr:ankyrin repeat domain-containing protein 40-like [Leptinotarsa decemlineata]XP_023027256.1 ankyrin repeat domain-containing protein 40-like [Leptinotarsa decemlineata]XP_023027257.1 ankyrin repeat domain-containing protein 40-like [Leptinotarsa decemlineata]